MIEHLSDAIKIVLVVVILSFGLPLKAEETRLKGFFYKFPEVIKEEIEKTKEYQKKEWGEAKEQGQALWESVAKFFGHLLPDENKEWEEVDEIIERKELSYILEKKAK